MIERVELNGFKGLTRSYNLDGPTLLLGRNGAGKTACQEALVYALTGRVPAGKSNDAAAQWFGPRGGYVRVHDSDGRWIQRGINRDHRKGTVSAVLATSDDVEGQPANLDAWRTADCTLDVREFLALSPDKRREYILRLVGGGTWTPETMETLEHEYAVALGGPGTPVGALTEPDAMPEALRPLAEAWTSPRGIGEWINLRLQRAKGTLSETIADLEALAKDEISSHRRAAAEGRAAAKELEAAAQGARVAAGDVDRCRDALTKTRRAAKNRETYQTRRDQAAARVAETTAELTRAREHVQELTIAAERASKAWVAAEEPKAPGEGGNPWAEKMDESRREVNRLEKIAAERASRNGALAQAEERLERIKAERARLEAAPIGKAWRIAQEIPATVHPRMPELRQIIEEISRVTWDQIRDRETAQQKTETLIGELQASLRDFPADLDAQVAAARVALDAAEGEFTNVQQTIFASQHGYREALRTYEGLLATFSRAQAAEDEARQTLAALDAELQRQEAALRVAETELSHHLSAEETTAALKDADAAADAAVMASGKVQAYEDAIRRAEDAECMEAAWKLAQKALKVVRDEYVGGSLQELLADIDDVLTRAGRPERAYLTLENERGRPIFDLGWQAGENRVSVASLSAGESVLFMAALAVAFLRKSDHLRILLLELDPLDSTNLPRLLWALPPLADELDAIVAGTSGYLADSVELVDGWSVVRV
jgi:recombinational DNA repair ATPase RecF